MGWGAGRVPAAEAAESRLGLRHGPTGDQSCSPRHPHLRQGPTSSPQSVGTHAVPTEGPSDLSPPKTGARAGAQSQQRAGLGWEQHLSPWARSQHRGGHVGSAGGPPSPRDVLTKQWI